MPRKKERQVIEALRETLAGEDLPAGLKITFRVSGGAPSKSVFEEIRMGSSGHHEVARSDEIRSKPLEKADLNLSDAETRRLFEEIAENLDQLVPRSEAAFAPDTVLGCVSVELEGKRADFFYAVDEDEPERVGALAATGVSETAHALRSLISQTLDGARREGRQ